MFELVELDARRADLKQVRHLRKVESSSKLESASTATHEELPWPNVNPHSVRHICGGTSLDHTKSLRVTADSQFLMSCTAAREHPLSAIAEERDNPP